MEYERIHKVQAGLISPSKLRMKLMGHQRKTDGSSSNSAKTSPSKLEDPEFVKNGLLASSLDFDGPVSSVGSASMDHSSSLVSNSTQGDQNYLRSKELTSGDHGNSIRARMQQFSKADSANSSSVHPMRTLEDDLDYDSNASSSSFEFPEGERTVHNPIGRSLLRPMSSKWNDAIFRFKHEDIKIQAWESRQKAKLDAEMRRIEAKVEQMKAHAQTKMVKKVAMAKQRSEEKRDAAEAKKTSQSQKLSAQAEHIRQTGSSPYLCCGWS